MRILFVAVACALVLGFACGGGEKSGDFVTVTLVNTTNEGVAVYINGSQYTVDPGAEDAISIPTDSDEEFAILATGLDSGDTLYVETLTQSDLDAIDHRIVITGD